MAQELGTAQFDYVFASGIFYLRPQGSYPYLEVMVQQMYHACRRGTAFNSLSTMSDRIDPDRFVADPARVLDACLKITPNVVLRHDHLPHDFTVYLYKDETSGLPRCAGVPTHRDVGATADGFRR